MCIRDRGTIMFLELRYLKEQKQYNLKENLKYTIKYLSDKQLYIIQTNTIGTIK